MNIRFVSPLTADDENVVAPALLTALVSFLDLLPFPYVLRIDTADAQVYEHCRTALPSPEASSGRREQAPAETPERKTSPMKGVVTSFTGAWRGLTKIDE